MTSVVQPWLQALPLKMQSVTLLGLRGCDGKHKEDPSKPLLRLMRQTVLVPANPNYMDDPDDNFMKSTVTEETAVRFLNDLDPYPMHWLMHFLHAAEIIGYKHPDEGPREFFWWLYQNAVVAGLHLNPESEMQLDKRLGPC